MKLIIEGSEKEILKFNKANRLYFKRKGLEVNSDVEEVVKEETKKEPVKRGPKPKQDK